MQYIKEAEGVHFFYLPGNHEKSRLTDSGVEIPQNLHVFGEEWTVYELDGVCFVGRSETRENMFSTLTLDESKKNVLVLHGELCDKSGADGKIGKGELARLPIDYVALGHYHSHTETEISPRCIAVYCGTPEGRGFDEAGECTYVTLTVSENGIYRERRRAAKRLIHICEVDVTDGMKEIEIESRVAYAVKDISPTDLVRVVLVGKREVGVSANLRAIAERFEHSFYYFEIKDKSKLRISKEDYINDKSLKGEFIRLVMSQDNLDEITKDAIIECGIRALAGESD